ncbi:MAG: DMT family transporter, partial [Cyanobacteria bacterium J06641_5]
MNDTTPLYGIYAKLLAMTLIWGGNFIVGSSLMRDLVPFSAAFLRFAIASGALVLLTWRLEGGLPRLRPRQLAQVVALGAIGIFAYNACFFLALQNVPASRAALVITTNPTAIALGAALWFGERLSAGRIAGILLAVIGAVTVLSEGNPAALLSKGMSWGDGYLLACILTWTIFTLLGRIVTQHLSPLVATTYGCLAGTPMFLVPALREGLLRDMATYSIANWLQLAYVGLLGTVLAFWWYYQGVRAIGAARTAVFINFIPVVAVTL